MPAHLFIYGTLLTGTNSRAVNAVMARHARTLGRGYIQGRLLDLGDYPGAVLSGNSKDRVYGQIIALAYSKTTLPILDAYENYIQACPEHSEFVRVDLPVTLCASGREKICWVYVYRGRQRQCLSIPSGNYCAYLHDH